MASVNKFSDGQPVIVSRPPATKAAADEVHVADADVVVRPGPQLLRHAAAACTAALHAAEAAVGGRGALVACALAGGLTCGLLAMQRRSFETLRPRRRFLHEVAMRRFLEEYYGPAQSCRAAEGDEDPAEGDGDGADARAAGEHVRALRGR